MNEPAARAAHTATRAVEIADLTTDRSGWQRAAEVAGLVALGLLTAAAVIPW